MKVAIIGTRGIPNNYGGFEQLAQHLSLGLKASGDDVTVYSQHNHSYKESVWNGVKIVHCFDPEKTMGTAGQFIYDFNCIMNSRNQKFDVIINLGYTSSSVWMKLLPSSALVITNMDGLEWKRTKYSKAVQRFLRYAEKLAVKRSDHLVADSRAIQAYIFDKYGKESEFIAYGAEVFDTPEVSVTTLYNTSPFAFDMLIARMEPENNIEMILEGVLAADSGPSFFVVGSMLGKYGNYLLKKFSADKRIIFTGPLYDSRIINNLRYYSRLYFHGHSVGGTNPSLLEAMGCGCLIAANENIFNRSVLGNNALYFSTPADVTEIYTKADKQSSDAVKYIETNKEIIRNEYSWEKIVSQYQGLMRKEVK